MSEEISVGQSFRSDDRGIEVIVVRVGSATERARFRIRSLTNEKASYTVTIHRRSAAEPDRIQYETDNPHNPEEYELSADETASVEVRREKR